MPRNGTRAHCRMTPAEVLWFGVTKGDGCWERGGYRDKDGYTRIRGKSNRIYAHRAAWEEATGERLTADDVIGHVCDNPPCIRNDDEGVYEINGTILPRRGHLFKGTNADNIDDRSAKGRAAFGKRNGHYTKPDRTPRGDNSWPRQRPELLARGDRNGSRKHPERLKRGEDHFRTTMTAPQVLEIRRLSAEGASLASIGEQFSISKHSVWDIVHRRTWKHV